MVNFLLGITTDDIVIAICNTLIHSLWQGLILAMFTGIIILFSKKSSADLRYKLLSTTLILFSIVSFATFIMQFNINNDLTENTSSNDSGMVENVVTNNEIFAKAKSDNFLINTYNYLNSKSSIIVLIWFLIVWIKYIKFSIGLLHINKLKHKQLSEIGLFWENKVDDLSQFIGIKSKIKILQSALIKSPLTIGHFKPLILIPVGLVNNLTTVEVEAIILHELSHIKRKDYLVNLLQSILEIIFFFNPAVLWISTLIRAERENCCDDIVINKTSDASSYIRALISCQEYYTNNKLAMAFANNKTSLIERVKRITSNNNQNLNIMEKGFLTFSTISVIVIALTISTSNAQSIQKTVAVTTKNIEMMATEAKKMIIESEKMQKEAIIMEAEAKKMLKESEEMAKDAILSGQDATQEQNEFIIVQPKTKEDSAKISKMYSANERAKLKNKEALEKSKEAQEKSKDAQKIATKKQKIAEEISKDILEELIKNNVVKNSFNLTYTLTENAFIVNDKKQPSEMHQKFAKKYITNDIESLHVEYDSSSSTITKFIWGSK